MRPSPFVATAVLRHHAELNKQEFPDASKAILSSFYVNDFIGGAATVEEALHLQQSISVQVAEHGWDELEKVEVFPH